MRRRRKRSRSSAESLAAIAVRMPAEIVAAVDAVASDLSRAAAGMRVSRSDVVRVLLTEALAARGLLARPGRSLGDRPH